MSERSNASFVSPISSMSPLQKAINGKFKGRKTYTWPELSSLINAESVHTSYAPPGREKVSVLNAFSKNDKIAPRLRAMGARSMRSAYTLRRAIYYRDVEKARHIINEERPDLTHTGPSGISTLSIAIQYTPDVVIDLIGAGADINTTNRDGTTPLMVAIGARKEDIALQLMEAGADIDAAYNAASRGIDDTIALRLIPVVIKYSVKHDKEELLGRYLTKDGSVRDMMIGALLYDAILLGKLKYINLAIAYGAPVNVNVTDTDGATYFYLALARRQGDQDIIKRIQNEIDNPTIVNVGDRTKGGSKKRRSHRRRKTRKPRKH